MARREVGYKTIKEVLKEPTWPTRKDEEGTIRRPRTQGLQAEEHRVRTKDNKNKDVPLFPRGPRVPGLHGPADNSQIATVPPLLD